MAFRVTFGESLTIPIGCVAYASSINKYGRATDVDTGGPTDIWDRANATDLQKTWTAPTAARVHNISSSSANDTSAGTGARTIRLFGMTSWDAFDSSEVVTLNGTSDVATASAYVIVHRMTVLTWGSAGPNVGVITATAATDATVTAQIGAGNGQTLMAVYGVASTHTLFMPNYYGSVVEQAPGANERHVVMSVLVWRDPVTNPEAYTTQSTIGFSSRGGSPFSHEFAPYKQVPGPCVVKMQASATASNLDVSAGFNGYLLTT